MAAVNAFGVASHEISYLIISILITIAPGITSIKNSSLFNRCLHAWPGAQTAIGQLCYVRHVLLWSYNVVV